MMQEILFEVYDPIAILTVNRPEARNALNRVAQEQFSQAVKACSNDSSLRALIITGAGDKAFVAGGDIKELIEQEGPETGEQLQSVMSSALHELGQLPIPVIAAVNGAAVGGGCEILTACDMRVAVSNAIFRFAQVNVGLTTGWGGTARLIRLIGLSRASDWLLTGRIIEAREAESCGFVNRLVPDEVDLMEFVTTLALDMVRLPKQALAANKALITRIGYLPVLEGYEEEKQLFTRLWYSEERREAMRTNIEKKQPEKRREHTVTDKNNHV